MLGSTGDDDVDADADEDEPGGGERKKVNHYHRR